jgi:nucleoside-diphosphate-sugar epimerase
VAEQDRFDQGFARRTVEIGRRGTRRPPSASTTLVTGASGFIGSHLVRALLDSGRDVVGFDVRPFTPEAGFILGDDCARVPLEFGSVGDITRLFDVVRGHRPNEIVHLGMIIDPDYQARHRATAIQVNILGTMNVLEAMIAFGVDRLINFSSIGVLPRVLYEPVDVQHPVLLGTSGPATDFYGSSKLASEALCFAYHQALGVDFRTIRPSAVYGLGMNQYVGPIKAMVESAVQGKPMHLEFGGRHPRAYTHARDIAGLVLAMLAAPDEADRIFYGSTGEPLTSTSEVAQLVRELIPGADVSIGEELAEREAEIVAIRGRLSIDNARTQLGWEPEYASLQDGIAQYAEQYRTFLATQA